ncbi:Exopolyphosphatase [Paecilomyces lecythidis]|uniref:Exopolyphosphatase n=1 Tax=Paecilomyces lecythidis TaxID=3004212 RepID=A0ABR3YCR4_9EURO
MSTDTSSRVGLLEFLRRSHAVQAQYIAGDAASSAPIQVLGNTSADLDSIISAIIYSYFANGRVPSQKGRPHVPLINLIDVPSGSELRRLRPEFVTALWWATNKGVSESESWHIDDHQTAKFLRERFLTIMDLKAQLREHERAEGGGPKEWHFDTTLVDWNALPVRTNGENPGRGSIENLPDVHFDVVACIDHHVDEDFVPPADSLPADNLRVVQPGPGSCTSLIVRELRSRGLWSDKPAADLYEAVGSVQPEGVAAIYEAQAAKLALAAILIDTTNLTAEGKVTDVDRDAVAFLEAKIEHGYAIHRSLQLAAQQVQWDRRAFFDAVQSAKQNSLDFLTIEEILGRDYKDWTETSSTPGTTIRLGMCSVVKPISWLAHKASTAAGSTPQAQAKQLLSDIQDFSQTRELDVVAIMTAFVGSDGEFQRELLVWSINTEETVQSSVRQFAEQASKELALQDWTDGDNPTITEDIRSVFNSNASSATGWRHLWSQKDLAKSRKQVAPLLRNSISKI